MFAEIHCTFHIMAWHGYNFSLCPVLEILWNLALMSKTAGSIVEAALKRDPHEVEFIQSVQEVVHALERVIAKNSQYVALKRSLFTVMLHHLKQKSAVKFITIL